MNIVCPCCGRKILSHASAVCNWCGFKIEDPEFQRNTELEREQFFLRAEDHDQVSIQKQQVQFSNLRIRKSYYRYGLWLGDIRSQSNICLTIAVVCFVFCFMRGFPAVNALRTSGLNGYVIVDGGRQVTQSPVKTELEIAGLLILGGFGFGTAAIRLKE